MVYRPLVGEALILEGDYDILLLAENKSRLHKSISFEPLKFFTMNPTYYGHPVIVVGAFIAAIASLTVPFLAAFWAYRKLRQDLRKEVQGIKYASTLQAHQEFWKLLAYTTDTENTKSVMRWELNKDKSKSHFFQKKNAQNFIEELANTFYGEGHGLFIPKAIRNLFFEYRSIVYGVLLKTKADAGEEVSIEKPEMAKRLSELHHEMTVVLRDSLNLREPDLPEKM